jgi:hypothetical protein
MEILWHRISPDSPGFLSLEDFSKLPAPRQAEWFDREFQPDNPSRVEIAALRLHLLGRVLHPNDDILTNPLLRQLAHLIVHSAASAGQNLGVIDVMTTNVDCALEQNIAWAVEQLGGIGSRTGDAGPVIPVHTAQIETIVDFRRSASWEFTAGETGLELKFRLWKLHGCLRDLKIQLGYAPEMTRTVLQMAGGTGTDICGHVPMDKLAANLDGDWRQAYHLDIERGLPTGVFSQSEYYRNLLKLAHGELEEHDAPTDEQLGKLAEFRRLLESRPLIFVGYSVPEVDVDIVYALQQYRRPGKPVNRWQLLSQRECTASSVERLRQMGVEPWSFEVPGIGFSSVPGKLRAARRHEWRWIPPDEDLLTVQDDKDWRRALAGLAARAWLQPQLLALSSLALPGTRRTPDNGAGQRPGLVVVGLASIWHGVALTKTEDFPAPRRVSARLISVDAQVPGGSGLVPVMVAAAAAGPTAVGSMTFFSNAPRQWGNWDEIEDMCLSAGVAVHPWNPGPDDEADGLEAVARTSHVILFDPEMNDSDSRLPRQRFIMDVQGLANEALAPSVTNWSKLKVPPARPQKDFQEEGQEDFLFTDKECDPEVIASWTGPTVYETGASGDELATRLAKIGAKPTIWTAGVGSLIRTLVALANRVPTEAAYSGGLQAVMDYIDADPRTAVLADCEDLRERYFARLISFGRRNIWDYDGQVGFRYEDELDYGRWLQDHWRDLEGPIWGLLGAGSDSVLKEPHARIGGGLLTTIHEGGLMALWRWKDGRTERVSVRVNTVHEDEGRGPIVVSFSLDNASGERFQDPVSIRVGRDQITLAAGGLEEELLPCDPVRRNTLAAGDTVRGAMAYGLWEAGYRDAAEDSIDIQRIFLASTFLASLKCYSGSFVDFLKVIERLRGTPIWRAIWGF